MVRLIAMHIATDIPIFGNTCVNRQQLFGSADW